MHNALPYCLTASPEVAPVEHLDGWRRQWRGLASESLGPVALALRGGFGSDRVGWAFVSGYQAALRSLMARSAGQPVAVDELLAFCATESGGNRPRDIRTTVTGEGRTLRVNGEKSWTTLGGAATAFLVVGCRPEADHPNRPTLKVAYVPASAAGITFIEKPPLAFVPEIPHTGSHFDNVAPGPDGILLPGDGYSDYVKPFRAIEDTFIALAVQAWLLREARLRGWPAAFREHLAAQLTVLGHLAGEDPSAPATHVALAGALTESSRVYDLADQYWKQENDATAERWWRDRPLFNVASKPREIRAHRAWEALAGANG